MTEILQFDDQILRMISMATGLSNSFISIGHDHLILRTVELI